AGGGGKGMRIVDNSADFKAALASCKREAISSFGDDKVLIEKYLTRPRHIEIQVFADSHGNCVYLFERDCSVQRRHQKVLEEAPAPGMTEERRRAMGEAAVAAAKAVGYVGAGTVEFIANQDGSFYFMEMNTRLQVEHPVTEMITGQDLVEWQLRVASGEALPLRQDQLAIHGHALEARIYAENPDNNFLPSIGRLRHLRMPDAVTFTLGDNPAHPAPVRIDSGVRAGDAISPFYDPMIAKLIVWGRDRDEALAQMANALTHYQVVGLTTNIAFLKRLVESPPFAGADLDTGLIERNQTVLFPASQPASFDELALAAVALVLTEPRYAAPSAGDPWARTDGWRMNMPLRRRFHFIDREMPLDMALSYQPQGWTLEQGGASALATLVRHEGHDYAIRLDGRLVRGTVVTDGEDVHVFAGERHALLRYIDPLLHAGEAEDEGGRLTAPMPGKIVAILVKKDDAVVKGAPLLIMEAMKMEHTIAAPRDGVVHELLYATGDQVEEGVQLLSFQA
ncbi:MAG: acetyl/propionyl/methylcrotonyl-CoA carboxylase subunit alpha, partial [Burkholderia sp.]|nr:acetyl/propionyl/methylcrotonyl-CoA carboxylase subunit alpha [Burkholderia sp.]